MRVSSAAVGLLGLAASLHTLVAQTPDKSGVKPSKISLPSGPGSIEGLGESFEPQLNTGTSTYSVGIDLPPGRAGLQPSLSLSYNSGLGNSFVGVGWDFGLPQIMRQTDKGFPSYNLSDTFLFQGEELVPLSDGTFRCENETGFQRFRIVDGDNNSANGFEGWEMTERNGTKHFFGRYRGAGDRHSAVVHPTTAGPTGHDRTYCWAIDQTIDLHGNRIEYEYILGTGKLYPARISYSHAGALAHEVYFTYEARPDNFDDYRPTFSCRIDRRLAGISILTSGQSVRSYGLEYAHTASDLTPLPSAEQMGRANAFDLGVSVLKRVTQFDRTGNHHLPPLIFYYTFIDQAFTTASLRAVNTPTGTDTLPLLDLADPSGHVQTADVNGDGLPDIFSTKPNQIVGLQQVCLNQGLGADGNIRFSAPVLASNSSSLDLSAANTSLTDVDADGIIDFVRLVDQTLGKRLERFNNLTRLDVNDDAIGLGFTPVTPSSQSSIESAPGYFAFGDPTTRQVDLNFDKISDLLHVRSEFTGLAFDGHYQKDDGTWSEFHTQTTIPSAYTFEHPTSGTDNLSVQLADMNGDRLQDYVVLVRSGTGIGATLTVRYWPYCALGQWGTERVLTTVEGDTFQIDGADLRDFFVQDFTGDGLADILRMQGGGGSSTLTLRANIAGTGWSAPVSKGGLPAYRPRDPSEPTTFRTADLNANGSTDLIWRNIAFADNTWKWLDLMPDAGKPNLLTRIDNSIGKITEIDYGNAHEDYVRAQDKGQAWTTKVPFAVQVVRQIRTRCGYDLNGDTLEDRYVSEFAYRDGFYDGFEKEFRGFAFAERIDYGDDFLWDPSLGVIGQSSGWDVGKTPTGQVSGPSLVTRYRFHTGAADRQDNDEPPAGGGPGIVDELLEGSGREEECLKGKQLLEEKIDPWVLHNATASDFDAAARVAALSGNLYASITSDTFVYTRARQQWGLRRLYRPSISVRTVADQDANGVLEHYGLQPLVPAGRLTPVTSQDLGRNTRSVSFAFVRSIETDVIEANGLLVAALGYESRSRLQTRKEFDYDDYGNGILELDHGILGAGYDDERKTVTSYALGGNALALWVISQPDTITTTDENNLFVNKTVHFYDGNPYEGTQGQITDRALLHRVQTYIDATTAIDDQRLAYDAFGNVIGMRDPNYGTAHASTGGHERSIAYDTTYHTYPTQETIVVGTGKPNLVMTASYDAGFGVVTGSTDFNANPTSYEYDSFARLVAIVKPGDTTTHPTQLFKYQAFDSHRGIRYAFARSGALTTGGGGFEANRVTTHARETSGTGNVYTTAVYTDGCGKTMAEVGEGEDVGTWIVSKATSHNLRGAASATWLPYQVNSANLPAFGTLWPDGRPPTTDGVNPSVVSSDTYTDPVGRELRTLQPPETWGGARKHTLTQLLPFEKRLFDENDSDPASAFANTPLVHFEDGLGRLTKVHEVVKLTDEGEPGPLTDWETRYTYDLNDKLTSITDSQNNLKVMTYDGLARLTFMDDPDRGVMHYVYDPASNLIQTTDAKTQVIQYAYDGVNRILSEDYLDAAALTPDVSYFYDAAFPNLDLGNGSKGTGSNPLGQLCYVHDLTGEEHFSYDARGRLMWQVKRIPDIILTDIFVSYMTAYAYDSLDRVTTLTYPDSDRVSHGYNNRNLLEHITGGPSGFIISNIDYQPSAQLTSIHYGNGVITTYNYDPRLRLRDLDTDSPVAGKLIDYAYSFDAGNNITQIDDNRDLTGHSDAMNRKNTQVFQYDDLYRLKQVAYPSLVEGTDGTIDYRYDRIGNMLSNESNIDHTENSLSVTHLGTMSYGSDIGASGRVGRGASSAGPHALSSVSANGGRNYPYDANGNMTNIDGLVCDWDFKDRMVAVENGEMSAKYQYDYTDRRIIKMVCRKLMIPGSDARRTHYINRYFEHRPGSAPVKFVWNGDTRVARITTALDGTSTVTQRLRLYTGWNLISLTVGASMTLLDLAATSTLDAALEWNAENNLWIETGSEFIRPHVPIWLHANRDDVLEMMGGRISSANLLFGTGRAEWLSNTLDGKLCISRLPLDTDLWIWNAPNGEWDIRLGNVANDDSINIESGAVFYAISKTGGSIEVSQSLVDQLRFYHQDHLKSSNITTDYSGRLVQENIYYPFGSSRFKHGPKITEEAYTFTQKEHDSESDFHYLEARYLSTMLSRFTSADYAATHNAELIISNPQPLNCYSYCANNPIIYFDPTGLTKKKSMATSDSGLENVKSHEGTELNYYDDSSGYCTVGTGHLVGKRKCTEKELKTNITKDHSEKLLRKDLRSAEKTVNRLVKKPLTQNQFDALVSFVFNVGSGNFKGSSVLRELNKGNYNKAANNLLKWNKGRNKKGEKITVKGLTKRRQAERKAFVGNEEVPKTTTPKTE